MVLKKTEINKMSSGEKLQKQPGDKTPFREPLVNFGGKSDIKQFENNPNKLVRIKYGFNTLEDVEKEVVWFRESGRVFKEFSEKCDIPVVRVDMVIGEDKGRPALFEVVDRIDGANLGDTPIDQENVEEMTAMIDTLYTKLVNYHAEKYAKKLKRAHIVIYKSKNGHFNISKFPEIVRIIKEETKD